jgi:hypothetical protein
MDVTASDESSNVLLHTVDAPVVSGPIAGAGLPRLILAGLTSRARCGLRVHSQSLWRCIIMSLFARKRNAVSVAALEKQACRACIGNQRAMIVLSPGITLIRPTFSRSSHRRAYVRAVISPVER